MNSLLNYGSDDECEDSPDDRPKETRGGTSTSRGGANRQTDANYEEVQMDLSELFNIRDRNQQRHQNGGEYRRGVVGTPDATTSQGSNDSKSEVRESRRSRDDRRDRDRSRRDRDRRRRSPRRSKYSRSRSRSRERSRKYTRRYDRSRERDRPKPVADKPQSSTSGSGFFMPGISGRFRDQIERRKQLWQKKEAPEDSNKNGNGKKVWDNTTFAQDTDGKVANKFKRLMGIRNTGDGQSTVGDSLKKQEEMFSSMEQQYEVARTATHTMRGVGLGFGSFNR